MIRDEELELPRGPLGPGTVIGDAALELLQDLADRLELSLTEQT